MIEVITAIALLCQIHGEGPSVSWIEKRELKCQQEYLKCVMSYGDKTLYTGVSLSVCILKRGKK